MGLTVAKPNFEALENVRGELSGIVRDPEEKTVGIYPGKIYYDQNFSLEKLRSNLEKYRVLHIATHGEFIPGNDEGAYLVLGTDKEPPVDKLTIPKINDDLQFGLTNIHLVVLSACQTALGGKISPVNNREKSEGKEIPGLSYSFMRQGRAKAVIASLWSVNDATTARLMKEFYANLASKEPMTKAEALRRAQLTLMGSKMAVPTGNRGIDFGPLPIPKGGASVDLRHPYYWAPFTLTGNGL
jgi:CHAT domain-containing protein